MTERGDRSASDGDGCGIGSSASLALRGQLREVTVGVSSSVTVNEGCGRLIPLCGTLTDTVGAVEASEFWGTGKQEGRRCRATRMMTWVGAVTREALDTCTRTVSGVAAPVPAGPRPGLILPRDRGRAQLNPSFAMVSSEP